VAEPVLTVANQLTLLRMALTPALVVLVLYGRFVWALVVFVVAGVTDLLDGLIARLGHQKTTLGAFIDPIADKLLLSSSFAVLTWAPGLHVAIPSWLTVTTLSRDAIIVIAVAAINLTHGTRVFQPSWLGKASTVFQILTAGVALLLNALTAEAPAIEYVFQLCFGLTVASAVHYAWLASGGKVRSTVGG
jgi:cardiolipin synthase (CMP-forming)